MKKTKTKTPHKRAPNYAQIAKDLRESFLLKGFTTDQAYQLTLLVLSKSLQ
jgi:hypothetical protein